MLKENSTKTINIEELVDEAKKGNKDAYSELILYVEKDLYRVARLKLNNEEDVQDAIQETLINAYLSISKLRTNKYFKTWIIKILVNECNKIYKFKNYKNTLVEKYAKDNFSDNEYDYDEDNVVSDLDMQNIKKLLTDKEKDIFSLYYEDGLSSKQISNILNINENTVKTRIKSARDRLKKKYKTILIMVLIVFVATTGVVFGKDIIAYIMSLFNLKTVGYNNDNVIDAIDKRDWVQNVDMDYIPLDDNYSIRVDYLLMDDMNLYMIFDLQSKEDLGEYGRFSIPHLKIEDENGNVIIDNYEWSASKQLSLISGWKNISNSSNNIREMLYIITSDMPNMKNIRITLGNLILYNLNTENNYLELTTNTQSFDINIDEKFINTNFKNLIVANQDENVNFSVEKAMVSDMGFYAIVKGQRNNIDIVIEDSNEKVFNATRRLLNISDENDYQIAYYLITSSIPYENIDTILLKNLKDNSKKIELKIK